MTKLKLRTAIKRESRIQTNANLDSLVDDIVTDILTDYCNLARYYELLLENVAITLVDGQQTYALPADYNHLDVVRYGRGPSTPCAFQELKLQADAVKQTYPKGGLPLFYRLVRGGLSIFPYGNILTTDVVTIDYYITPASIYVLDADVFPVPRLESVVKKAAIARVQRFHSSDSEAQMTTGDANSSFNASNAGS